MALQKQVLSLDFTGGLDRSVNDKLTLKGKLTRLENAVFDTDNVLKKDGGYTALAASHLTAPQGGGGLYTLRDILLSYREAQVIRYVPSNGGIDTSAEGHTLPRRSLSVSDVGRLEGLPGTYDAAYASTTSAVYVWTEAGIGYFGIWESTSQTPYRGREVLATDNTAGVQQVRVVWDSHSSLFRIFYIRDVAGASPAGVYQRTLDPSSVTPWSLSAETLVEAAPVVKNAVPENAGRLDVCFLVDTGTLFLAVYRAADTRLIAWDGNAVTATKNYATRLADRGVGVAAFISLVGKSSVVVAIADSANNEVNVIETDVFLARAFTAALCYTGTKVTRVGIAFSRFIPFLTFGLAAFGVVWEDITAAAFTADNRSFISGGEVTADLSGVAPIGAPGTIQSIRSLGLASKPFRSKYGIQALGIQYSPIQPTFFLINFFNGLATALPDVHDRLLESEAGHYETPGAIVWEGCGHVASVSVAQPDSLANIDNSPIRIPVLRRSPIRLLGGQDTARDTLSEVTLTPEAYTFGSTFGVNQLLGAEYADSIFTCASAPGQYDGTQLYEAGFHNAPELPTYPVTPGGAGAIPAGTYSYVFVWEYYDMAGRRWLSEPSTPRSVVAGGGTVISVTIPTLRLTHKHSTAVNLLTYRTDTNGSIYYLQSSRANNPAVDSITFSDNTASASLIISELLYTTGGVLPNEPLPGCRLVTRFKNRLVFGGLPDPYSLQYTEELRDGYGIGTNAAYRLTVPATCGRVSGLSTLDDKLIVLCERGIWAFVGDGANRAGQADSFSEPLLVSGNIGCRYDAAGSVLATADGVWFLSSNGLRLLNRSLSIARSQSGVELGAEVDAEITSGVFCTASLAPSDKNQARFSFLSSLIDGFVLLYDGRWGQWSKFTAQPWIGMANWRGNIVLSPFKDPSGSLNQTLKTAGGTTQNGAAFYVRADTAWLNFAGVHGFQRVYRLLLLAKSSATGQLQVRLGYDYDTALSETWTLDMTNQPTDPVFVRHALAHQKCTALYLSIIEPIGLSSSTLVLSSLGLEVGIKRGAAKLGASRTV